jgi:SAM-dependent methyltransferase
MINVPVQVRECTCGCNGQETTPASTYERCCSVDGKAMAYARKPPGSDLILGLLPLADGSKDVVTWQACIFDLEVPGALLQESFRVLRPGGRLECCLLPTAEGRGVRVEWLYHWLADLNSFGLHQWSDGRVTVWAVNTPAPQERVGPWR